jgi:hypothetical protein
MPAEDASLFEAPELDQQQWYYLRQLGSFGPPAKPGPLTLAAWWKKTSLG